MLYIYIPLYNYRDYAPRRGRDVNTRDGGIRSDDRQSGHGVDSADRGHDDRERGGDKEWVGGASSSNRRHLSHDRSRGNKVRESRHLFNISDFKIDL